MTHWVSLQALVRVNKRHCWLLRIGHCFSPCVTLLSLQLVGHWSNCYSLLSLSPTSWSLTCCTPSQIFALLMHLMHCINFVMASAFSVLHQCSRKGKSPNASLSLCLRGHSLCPAVALAVLLALPRCIAVATAAQGLLDGVSLALSLPPGPALCICLSTKPSPLLPPHR
jgi:hypothetical protein